MIVYAESNFLLEWIRQQSGIQAVERIVELAEARTVQLKIPGCAFAEVRTTLERAGKESTALQDAIKRETNKAGGSAHGRRLVKLYESIQDTVRKQATVHLKRHDRFAKRCFRSAQILELNVKILAYLPETLSEYDLNVQDALVLATVVADAASRQTTETKLFVQKDKEDFNTPEIKAVLNAHDCECIWGFESALKKIESAIRPFI